MFSIRCLQIVLVLVVGLSLSSPAAFGRTAGGPAVDRAGGHEDRLEVVFSADGAPGPGGVTTLTFEVTPLVDAPDLMIEWTVPEGAELLGGPADAPRVVAAGSTVSSQRQVRFPSTGTYKVIAAASYRPAEGIQFVATGVLFFVIDEAGSRASDRDPDARSPMHTIMPGSSTTSSDRVEGPLAVEDDPCFTIQGRVERVDMVPTNQGYNSSAAWVRSAVVEVREEDELFDDSYGDLLTNEQGQFAGTFCDDDGLFDDELEIYVRLRAEIRSAGMTVVEVEDNSWLESVYEFDSWVVSSEGGTITFNLGLNEDQSKVFNIADAIYDAWDFWNDSGGELGGDAIFDDEAEAQWQPGWGEDTSHYDREQEEINVADDPSDPDPWDESPIMHEWGHFADDEYSCDDNPGGDHSSGTLLDDPELAWGEGYPDYYQSAVRWAKDYPFGGWYIDVRPGDQSSYINLETWDVKKPNLLSVLNEMAIAAALWDLYDHEPDGQDNVYHGHARIQDVYTSEIFEDIAYGFFDDTCDFDAYARAWVARGMPANKLTAAAIKQNTGYTLSPSAAMYDTATTQGSAVESELTDSIWWNQLTYVVDNSKSMAGDKFNAVKTVLGETINDLEAEPQGTEFTLETFNNTSLLNQEVFAGQFFGNQISPAASSLSTSSATDSVCRVHALRALNNAIADEYKGEAWLFTDGDTYLGGMWPVTVDGTIQKLNNRQMHASVALLGLCHAVSADADPEETAHSERLLRGAASALVGPAADETPGGVVPYLLTAIGTGGQFLFVDETQMADAADVLRAQFSHSAGAGSWSDYVSDQHTYRWDNLASWEYNWIDATSGGTNHGNPTTDGHIDIALPDPFRYYGQRGANYEVHAFENGYLTFGAQYAQVSENTGLPNPADPDNALYPFWDELVPYTQPTSQDTAEPSGSVIGRIYSKQERNQFAIEYYQYQSYSTGDLHVNTFEALLNATTGEIRYQYQTVPDGAASATIGLENADGSDGVQVARDQGIGAANGTGYKFTPAPPQPSKTYTVTVDSLMSGVGFLLMGYSGSFEPLDVHYPDGTQVNCHDTANVLCLDLGLVQYVQADVDDHYGDWKATVDAGPTGSGTFSFVSMAASELSPEFPGDHSLTTAAGAGLAADMGQPVDGDILTGWFVKSDDTPFGPEFPLYDDGAHGDGYPGDGFLGSDPFTPPEAGCAYLRVRGLVTGVEFIRTDRTPFCFHPLRVTSLGDGANFGTKTTLEFEVRNDDVHDHCYEMGWQWPEGWWLVTSPLEVCIPAGNTHIESVDVYMGADPNDLPSGTTGEVILSAVEAELGAMSDSASAWVTRRRPVASISIHSSTRQLRPNGDTATLEFTVVDEQGVGVADGTQIQLSATLGKITENLASAQSTSSSDTATTKGGYFEATFLSGPIEGTAVISASTRGALATTQIEIGTPLSSRIRLEVADSHLPSDGSSTTNLTAIATDPWSEPVAGQTVRIGVEGDGQMGAIDGGEVISGTTNSVGQFSATYTSGTIPGLAWLRAELIISEGGLDRIIDQDRQVIQLGRRLYLPLVLRSY